jgi:hypothetical protein
VCMGEQVVVVVGGGESRRAGGAVQPVGLWWWCLCEGCGAGLGGCGRQRSWAFRLSPAGATLNKRTPQVGVSTQIVCMEGHIVARCCVWVVWWVGGDARGRGGWGVVWGQGVNVRKATKELVVNHCACVMRVQ